MNNNRTLLQQNIIQTKTRYPFKCAVETPFYHMHSEPFWRLKKSADFVARPTYGIFAIRKCFEYAEIDEELFRLFSNSQSRENLRNRLRALLAN